jgi:hypothetical protein
MKQPSPSSIGYRNPDGTVSDSKLHEEIMSGVDDTPLRIMSAQRVISKLGFTREQAEELFSVKLPDDRELT